MTWRRSRSERLQSIANDASRELSQFIVSLDFLEDAFEEDILSTNELRLFFTRRKGEYESSLPLIGSSVSAFKCTCVYVVSVVIVVRVERKKDL